MEVHEIICNLLACTNDTCSKCTLFGQSNCYSLLQLEAIDCMGRQKKIIDNFMVNQNASNKSISPIEEGCICPNCHKSKLLYYTPKDCTCHLLAPCQACVESKLTCENCGCSFDETEN